MGEPHIFDMIVVGGGPGGYTAALYAARAGLDKPAAAPAVRPSINVPKPCPFIPRLLLFRRPAGFRRKRNAGDLTSKAGAAGLCLFFPEAGKNPLLNPVASAII